MTLILFHPLKKKQCWDYDFQRIESLNETTESIVFNLRAKRINRTLYGISGTIENLFVPSETEYIV